MTVAQNHKRREVLVLAPRVELCLDFANTLMWRGSTPEETLKCYADVVGWCISAGVLSKHSAREHSSIIRSDAARTSEMFAAALAIREVIYRVFYFTASGRSPAESDLRLLNDAMKRAPARTVVDRSGSGFGWRVEQGEPAAAALLAPVLWSAADLLIGPSLAKVRHCSNDQCLWVFIDDSKNGTRRWCSMQACGNRAKAHRHYLRQKRK